ncbi:hypothetical protein M0R45_018346 [Rubus argutus]|uniref:Uncharacterized protein n=1 Tax=Rubus argutus TaxID=59490 RepID=A0AAW1X616_RUBAR
MGERHGWTCSKRYKIKCRSPKAYFSSAVDEGADGDYGGSDFIRERQTVKEKYEVFEERIREYTSHGDTGSSKRRDHSAVIEVIQENSSDDRFEVTEAKCLSLFMFLVRKGLLMPTISRQELSTFLERYGVGMEEEVTGRLEHGGEGKFVGAGEMGTTEPEGKEKGAGRGSVYDGHG